MKLEETERLYEKFSAAYPDREDLLDAVTDATLDALRVPRKLLGYRYLFLAVRYILSGSDDPHPGMLAKVYPYVARCTGTSRVMAERAMHYAIGCAWKRADPEVLVSYLGLRGADRSDPPTNVEFIYLVAERVRLIAGDPAGEERLLRMIAEAERRFAVLSD